MEKKTDKLLSGFINTLIPFIELFYTFGRQNTIYMNKNLLASLILFLSFTFCSAQNPPLWFNTFTGGPLNGGTISKIKGDGTGFANVNPFSTLETPQAELVQLSNGKIYGITNGGGTDGGGIIFTYNPANDTYTTIYNFVRATGIFPGTKLMIGLDNKLYGLTGEGGTHNTGTLFKFDPVNFSYTDLYDFPNTTAANPVGGLCQTPDGKLWGMTPAGGVNGAGTIFNYDIVSSTFTSAFDLIDSIAREPHGSLLYLNNKFYGLSLIGGINGLGTMFCFDPPASVLTKIFEFSGGDGAYPYGSLTLESDISGMGSQFLIGMTSGGGLYDYGVIFDIDVSGNNLGF